MEGLLTCMALIELNALYNYIPIEFIIHYIRDTMVHQVLISSPSQAELAQIPAHTSPTQLDLAFYVSASVL